MGKVFDALSKAGAENKPVERKNSLLGKSFGKNILPEEKQPASGITGATITPAQQPVAPAGWDERFLAARANPAVAESFRRLRAKILHLQEKTPIRSVLITSSNSGEGKSFVCANLGAIMARGVDQHALLVDCDLRRPGLARFFGEESRSGLVDHLRDGLDLSALIVKTGLDRLSLIPAGTPPQNPSELLSSQAMSDLMKEVVIRYQDRFVIFDSPPAQAASETAVLAQHVDKVVLVVRWGGAGREQVKKLVEQMGREKILGVVFNAFQMNFFDKRLQGEGYYKYYSEEY